MDVGSVIGVGVAAFCTSMLTAIVGFGGGIVLLAVLLVAVEPTVAIPLHAAVQVTSNGTRTWIRWRDVDWSITWRSSLLLLPAGALAMPLVVAAPERVLQGLIAVVVLAATWVPERTASDLPAPSPRGWIGAGAVAGFLNPLVGATGPLFAPFFRAATRTRLAFVGTFAASQVSGHAAKLLLFGVAGLAPTDHLPEVAAGIVGVVAGTAVGSRILDRMSEVRFRTLYLAAITLVGLYLLVDALVG